MHYDAQYRIALGAILIAVFAVRVYGHAQTLRAGKIKWIESNVNIALRIVAGLLGIGALWTYLIWPEWILWASIPLPDWLRWTGVAIAALGTASLAWVHRELGRNFAATLHVRAEGHTLITSGPYRWVRNPMYTAIYLILLSFFLVSANWLIGLGWLAGFTALMISRVPKEEALMREKFGEQYRTWAEHTGRFLPRI
jgi:protein-S-isoprenylcysteine O-methyltransferase Ste14